MRASRRGDLCTGHDDCGPRPVQRGSTGVLVDDRPAVRQGDELVKHGCGRHAPHKGVVTGGSSTVSVDDRPMAREGDAVDCGSALGAGSAHVEVGG